MISTSLYSKRRLFNALSWLVVAAYIVINISMVTSGLNAIKVFIVLPIVNVILIALWFFIRTFYNNANDTIRHAELAEERPPVEPIPVYGHKDDYEYVPDIRIENDLFIEINANLGNKVLLDVTLKDYLKPGRVITFHNKSDYGMMTKVKVIHSKVEEKGVTVTFSEVDEL